MNLGVHPPTWKRDQWLFFFEIGHSVEVRAQRLLAGKTRIQLACTEASQHEVAYHDAHDLDAAIQQGDCQT